ncbi:MAG: LysR family transcriptional regulator [Alphaproteobacteria bacterium]|nr:LysR family transcriptional regulator [Alphaproteobacteria bacterium]
MFEKRSDLRKFLAVAETGTVLGAADRIAMTQPALSRAIARLENSFGGKLFERLPTGVRLTEFGATVAEQARHILGEMETAEGAIKSALTGHANGLRITAGPTWMQAVLPEAVARFHDAFPEVELRLHAMTFLEGIRLLVNGESDLHCGRIDVERRLPAILRRESFLDMTSRIVARSDHPLHAGEVTCSDLAEWPWIDCEASARTQDDEDRSPLAELLDEISARTGKHVRTVVRAGPAGLALMGTGPYLSRLPVTFLDRLPGLRLKPLPLEFGVARFRAGLVSRISAWDFAAFRYFAETVRDLARRQRGRLRPITAA